jgi:hypothetical protein
LHASQSTALVLEVFRAIITGFGTPEEVLTGNGTQYVTWRGKSAFARECEKRGIQQIVASPHRPCGDGRDSRRKMRATPGAVRCSLGWEGGRQETTSAASPG